MDTLRTFYVSSGKGSDKNPGRTMEEPFATLNAINEIELQPGDSVLLECGSIFENQFLVIRSQGTLEHPIRIGKYGEGPLPVIHGNGRGVWYQDYGVPLDSPCHEKEGEVSSTVLLWDASYIEVTDLEITNSDFGKTDEDYSTAHKRNRTGVSIVARDRGTLHHIFLKNLFVHDVEGNVYNKHMNNGGICASALKPLEEEKTGVARFDGLTVEDCYVYGVSRWGISLGYTYQHGRFSKSYLEEEWFKIYGHEHVVLRNNYVKHVGGDGITPMYALRPLVEHNTVDYVAVEMNDRVYSQPLNRAGKVAAAVWPWKCKDALFRYNLTRDTVFNQDGMAYDADSGDGTVYEYNYSRYNEGGCIMFCLEQSVNNIFRHNISKEDLSGIISPIETPDAYIAENIFYKRKETPLLRPKTKIGNYQMEKNQLIILEE